MIAYAVLLSSGQYVGNIYKMPFLFKHKSKAVSDAVVWGKGARVVKFDLSTPMVYGKKYYHPIADRDARPVQENNGPKKVRLRKPKTLQPTQQAAPLSKPNGGHC